MSECKKQILSKSSFNFIVNTVALVLFFFLTVSGLILHVSHGQVTSWGVTGHAWKDMHFIASLIFVAVTSLHLIIHWKWIVCTIKSKQGWEVWMISSALIVFLSVLVVALSHHDGSGGDGRHDRRGWQVER